MAGEHTDFVGPFKGEYKGMLMFKLEIDFELEGSKCGYEVLTRESADCTDLRL